MPAWREVQLLVGRELGERVYGARPLTPVRLSRMTWAARTGGTGAIVVKVRAGDDGRAEEKARWCAAHLPVLGARGYPVPVILWAAGVFGVCLRTPNIPFFCQEKMRKKTGRKSPASALTIINSRYYSIIIGNLVLRQATSASR
jgi:hypothetical protein